MNLSEVLIQPVGRSEELRYQQLMQEHHCLGRLPKSSETLGVWQEYSVQVNGCHSRMLLAGIQVSSQFFLDSRLRGNDCRSRILDDYLLPST